MDRQRRIATARRRLSLAAALAAIVLGLADRAAQAADAVLSYDGARALVSKDVGEERWAITRNTEEDRTVTGNVFRRDGGDPQFLWCEDVSDSEQTESGRFSCWGAQRCLASPCESRDWVLIAEITLPLSFFATGPGVQWESLGTVSVPLAFLNPPPPGTSEARGSGVQITPDGARNLISKDVGDERWAITWNQEDASLTGNVFRADGGEPRFLWCEETGRSLEELAFSCFIAAVETLGPIPDAEGNFFVNQLTGDDANPGSQERPFATIQGALDAVAAVASSGDLYVAGGVYRETVVLRSRVNLYGGFDPSSWVRDLDRFPSIVEGRRELVLASGDDNADADGVRNTALLGYRIAGVVVDGFTIVSPDAEGPGESSVAVNLTDARLVTISRSTILAGNGAPGAPGGPGRAGLDGFPGGKGDDAGACDSFYNARFGGRGGAPPPEVVGTSEPTRTEGGDGGAPGNPGVAGSGLLGGRPGSASPGGFDAGSGQPGGPGPGGTGGPGGGAFGRLDEDDDDPTEYAGAFGYVGYAGSNGSGGGGGGGAGLPFVFACGGGGGGGGSGGFGGGGGQPGMGGGASIGVLLGFGSDADLSDNLISTGTGGDGAPGGLGGDGGKGGAGGAGGARFGLQGAGGRGGDGGTGGKGGPGGGGGGGPSAGILEGADSRTLRADNVFDVGQAGRGGLREDAPESTRGRDGMRGEYLKIEPEAAGAERGA